VIILCIAEAKITHNKRSNGYYSTRFLYITQLYGHKLTKLHLNDSQDISRYILSQLLMEGNPPRIARYQLTITSGELTCPPSNEEPRLASPIQTALSSLLPSSRWDLREKLSFFDLFCRGQDVLLLEKVCRRCVVTGESLQLIQNEDHIESSLKTLLIAQDSRHSVVVPSYRGYY